MAMTKKVDTIIPEVMADIISAKLANKIRFMPIAEVDRRLVGNPGDTITVPSWEYIGDAVDVAEGEPIPLEKLTASDKKMTIKKAGKGTEITDEAMLSALGDPKGEAAKQLAMAIASKVDNDIISTIAGATQAYGATGGLTLDNIEAALAMYNDEDLEPMVIFASPTAMGKLIKEARLAMQYTESGVNALIQGSVGKVLGAELVRTRRLDDATAYVVKKGAVRLPLKRDTLVESERDIIKKTTVITADKHYGVYLYDPTKVVKITIS